MAAAVFVECATFGDGAGDEVGFTDYSPALLFLPGYGVDCGYVALGDGSCFVPFAAGLTLAKNVSSSVPDRMASEVLDIELVVLEADPVDGSMGTVFDDLGLSIGEPLAEVEPVWSQQHGGPGRAALPAVSCRSSLNERVHW